MKIADNTLNGIGQYITIQLEPQYDSEELLAIKRQMIEHYFGLSQAEQVLQRDRRFSESELLKIVFAIKEMKYGKPLQYITGETDFFGRRFVVTPDVLIPRPETEELCDWIITDASKDKQISILDIGTGSGCIPVTLAGELTNSEVSACEVSLEALKVAKQNGDSNNVKVEWHLLDILMANDRYSADQFDVIVSNPPYVLESDKHLMAENVVEHEPHVALFVPDDNPLLFYGAIAQKSKRWLKPGGLLYFEIHEKLGRQTVELLQSKGYVNVELREDMFGKDRLIKAQLN